MGILVIITDTRPVDRKDASNKTYDHADARRIEEIMYLIRERQDKYAYDDTDEKAGKQASTKAACLAFARMGMNGVMVMMVRVHSSLNS